MKELFGSDMKFADRFFLKDVKIFTFVLINPIPLGINKIVATINIKIRYLTIFFAILSTKFPPFFPFAFNNLALS